MRDSYCCMSLNCFIYTKLFSLASMKALNFSRTQTSIVINYHLFNVIIAHSRCCRGQLHELRLSMQRSLKSVICDKDGKVFTVGFLRHIPTLLFFGLGTDNCLFGKHSSSFETSNTINLKRTQVERSISCMYTKS